MSIFDFGMIEERKPTTSGQCAVIANEGREQGILEKLINAPMADSSVLKHIYHAIHSFEDPNQKMMQFLDIWRTLCMPKKAASIEELVDHFYDKVDGEKFENFINEQADNYAAGRQLLQMAMADEHQEYVASGLLRVASLEKMLSLLIASEVMPTNFFIVLNFVCSEQPELKPELLSAVYNLHLIGYSPSLEIRFLSL